MARREDVETAIWSDPDFLALSPHAKLVYLWSFTNQRCGMAGLYKAVPEAMRMETGLNAKQATSALAELSAARFVFFDDRVLWVRSRVKHLRSKSGTIAKAVASDVLSIGSHHYVKSFLETYRNVEWLQSSLGPIDGSSMGPLEPIHPIGPQDGVQGNGKGTGKGNEPTETDDARERPIVRFNGKIVPGERVQTAVEILEDFNEREGTSYLPFGAGGKPTEPFKRLLGALIDRPHIKAEMGRRVNEVALGSDRFWEGVAQPGNVWGPNVVDRNVARAMGAGPKKDVGADWIGGGA